MDNSGIWISDPPKKVEIIEMERTNGPWINAEHFWFDMYVQGKLSKEELELRLKNK